jgi:preprotein translocase subunit SecA
MGMFEDFLSGQDANKRSKGNEAYLQQLASRVDRINLLEPTVEDLGDDELESKTAEFKERLTAGEDLNGALLEEAFAVVREAAW